MAMRVEHPQEALEHPAGDLSGLHVGSRLTRAVSGRLVVADARMRFTAPAERAPAESGGAIAEADAESEAASTPTGRAMIPERSGNFADYDRFWRSRVAVVLEPDEPIELVQPEATTAAADPPVADAATTAAAATDAAASATAANDATTASPAATPAATDAATDAAPTTTDTSAFVGEPSVDAQWLADREAAFVAVRADYEAARAEAIAQGQAAPGSAAGWIQGTPSTDESGNVYTPDGAPAVFVNTGVPVQVGFDEGGPVYQTGGHWLVFDEETFAASYRAQAGAPLLALAALYDSDPAALFAEHPELWRIALSDHALNAGPAPEGHAMGDAGQLGMLDLYLSDPQIQALITAFGGTVDPASGGIAREQVRLYGQQRYEQLSRLGNAMAAVRAQYGQAMADARNSGTGPGWTEVEVSVSTSDESGFHTTTQMVRSFDVDQFTAWYVQQPGAQHQAFADFYGASHTTVAQLNDESGQGGVSTTITFDNPNWTMYDIGGAMTHRELIAIDPNRPPDLYDDNAVGFDLETGWATHHSNIEQDEDWFESLVQIVIVGVVAYFSAGMLGPAAAGAMGLTTTVAGATTLTATGLIVSAAVAGAATSVASGMLSGNLNFKDILRGALSGALTAGLMNGLGPVVSNAAGPAGMIALRGTVQGGVQALLGGSFRDGALAGFASGLADLTNANLQDSIKTALQNGVMNATEAATARMFARVLTSAIRAAGSPDNPNHAFASAFLDQVLQQAGEPAPAVGTAFDDDGNLMPGVVDPSASLEDQQAQLQARLEQQGLSAELAAETASSYYDEQREFQSVFFDADAEPVLLADASGWSPQVRSAREVIDGIESRIASGELQGADIGQAVSEAYQSYLQLANGLERSGLQPTVSDEAAASRLIGLISDLGEVARQQGVELTTEQAQLVRLARGYEAQRHLPDILGAAGGILGSRQVARSRTPVIRNEHLAGSVHPRTGIPFDKDGYPDFSKVAIAEVKITLTGTRAGDFRAANQAANLPATPEGYTWHHHQDRTTMQLVPRDIHALTGHTGGFQQPRP